MKINIVVAKRDRDFHYEMFIHYLDLISAKHDVHLYVSDCVRKKSEPFNKAELLNDALKEMKQDFDVVCVFDIDMIYSYDFFNNIENLLNEKYNYIVSYGRKLTKEESEEITFNKPKYFGTQAKRFQGCSQITLTKECLDIFEKYFGDPLYDEYYEGWGGEDSDLSFKSKILNEMSVIKKTSLNDAWFHLWHPENRLENYRETNRNSLYFQNKKTSIMEVVANYVS